MATPDYEPQPQDGHALVEYNGCTYLIGGEDSNKEPIDPSTVAILDPVTLKWQRRTTTGDIPEAVDRTAYTVYLHSFYCFGGWIQGKRHNKMWRLDLTTLEWSSIQQKKTPPLRSYAGLVACNGVALLLYGGIGNGHTTLMDLHVFSLQDGEWSTPAVTGHPPPPLQYFSFTLMGSRAVLFAGYDDDGGVDHNDVYCLDIDRKHWSKELVSTGGPQPRERWAHAAVALSSQALLYSGGYGGRGLDDCWILDLSTWRWREVVLPGGGIQRRSHAAAAVRIENTVTIMEFGGRNVKNVVLAATSVLQMTLDNESKGGVENWRLVDYIAARDGHKWSEVMRDKLGM